jgi:DHA2 family multidrug resistance protein
LAPTLGPVVGGWITDSWSWQWLFYINIVPGMLVASLVPILVRMDRPDLALLKGADYLGMVLMAVSLGCLDYVLEEGARWEWFGDYTIRSCAWISGLAGIGFIIRCLTFSRPVVDLRALASRNFALGCWFSFVTGVGQFSMIYLIPVFLGSVRGFSSSQIGIAMLSAGVFQLCTIPIYSMFANRVDLRWLLMFGLACYGMSMWLFTFMMNQWGWEEMLLPLAFRGLASPFSFGVNSYVDPWRAATRSPEVGKRSVLADAQLGRCNRNCGLWHHPQRSNQSPFPPYCGASDVCKRAIHESAA